ncbi:hypothetical protein N9B94_01270 [Verrucomicrobia bacterium]|nr:hypothetical protein [Verrucomicrobiota bacterium]
MPDEETPPIEKQGDFHAVILYADACSRLKAEELVCKVAWRLAARVEVIPESWHIDTLMNATLRDQIERAVEKTDLFMVALGDLTSVPTEVKMLLEAWVMGAMPCSSIAVSLLYRNACIVENWDAFSNYLEDLSVKKGINYFEQAIPESEGASSRKGNRLLERASTNTSLLRKIISPSGSYKSPGSSGI